MTLPVLLLAVGPALAQANAPCKWLCAPSLKVEPTITFESLFGAPRVRTGPGGEVRREGRERVFEMIVAMEVPTRWPRLALTAEAIWAPFASGSRNPFTGRSAAELGVEDVRDNPPELEFEVNFKWLLPDNTGGWVSSHLDVVDKFSPAERLTDRSAYTHKLNLELDTAVAAFRWLPEGHWLRGVEIEASLDYVATGLPRAGEEVGPGELLVDDASRWSLSLVLVIPVAP